MTCEHGNTMDLVHQWCQDCGAISVMNLGYEWIEPSRNDEFPVFSAWEMHLKAAVGLANSAGQSPTETISALVMILSESVEPAALVRALGLACSANGDLYLLCDAFMRETLAKREEPCPK